MRIIKPSVKQISLNDNIQQIGYAASICYASNKQGSVEFLEQLWNKGHRSPFRHGTRYYIFNPAKFINRGLENLIFNSPYCASYKTLDNFLFVSTNEQFYKEHPVLKLYKDCEVSDMSYFAEISKYGDDDYSKLLKTVRLTFEAVTQVSTSRELNRVSPNNICEQSTRYCNFKHEKFGNQVTYCQPHWIDCLDSLDKRYDECVVEVEKSTGRLIAKYNDDTSFYLDKQSFAAVGVYGKETNNSGIAYVPVVDDWVEMCISGEQAYFHALKHGMKPQDARGLLPLDLATKVIYTYTIGEWLHILDLRYFGKYGTPHPNAYIIAKEIYDRIYEIYPRFFE